MRRGKYEKISTRKFPIWLLLVLLILFGAAIYFAYDIAIQKDPNNINQTEPTNAETDINEKETVIDGKETINNGNKTDINENETGFNENDDPTLADGDDFTQPDVTIVPTEIAPTEPMTQPSEPYQTEVLETSPPVVIVQQADAEYERWLASALVVAVSMEYPDFIPDQIYSASSTSLEEKFRSDGVYIVFSSNGATKAIHSKPISGERSEAGTKDISSETIGFATFDFVDPSNINVDSMHRIALEDLGELIAQSLLISIYTH